MSLGAYATLIIFNETSYMNWDPRILMKSAATQTWKWQTHTKNFYTIDPRDYHFGAKFSSMLQNGAKYSVPHNTCSNNKCPNG